MHNFFNRLKLQWPLDISGYFGHYKSTSLAKRDNLYWFSQRLLDFSHRLLLLYKNSSKVFYLIYEKSFGDSQVI